MLHLRCSRSIAVPANLLLCLVILLSFAPAGLAGQPQGVPDPIRVYLPAILNRPVRFYESSGLLDTAFGGDGLVTTNLAGALDYGNSAVVQPDGKTVIVGYALASMMYDVVVARYNPDGSLDTGFDFDGFAVTDFYSDDYARAVALQTDGKIVIAGTTWNLDSDFLVGRYNPDGSVDTGFGDNGTVVTDINGSSDDAYAIAIQPDGKILVAGTSSVFNSDFAVVRYHPDGTPDTTFDFNGIAYTDINGGNDGCYGLLRQADGNIVLAGYASNATKDFALVRFKPDGSLDPDFDGDGKLTTDFAAGNDYAYSAAQQLDGKIVVAGYAAGATRDFALARYNPDGSLDGGFDTDGRQVLDFAGGDDRATGVVWQPDGKIVAAGYNDNPANDDFALARFNANGSLDTTFEGGGKLVVDFNGGDDQAYALVLQTDGKLLVAGQATGQQLDFAAARFNPSGSLDLTFGDDGKLLSDLLGSGDTGSAARLQPDGKLVVVGSALGETYDIALARYNPDGSPDTSFSGDGRLVTDLGLTHEYGTALTLQPDGKILVAGYRYADSYVESDFVLLRYHVDGSLDNTFSGDGIVLTDFSGADDFGHAIARQTDGKIIVVGYSYEGSHKIALARYNPDGSLDDTFDGDGMVATEYAEGPAYGNAVALQADGKIVVAGSTAYGALDFVLMRYSSNGSLDGTFDTDGMLSTDFAGQFDECMAVLIQPDGKILAAGYNDNASNDDFALARYNPNGSLDTGFDDDGLLVTDLSGGNDRGYGLALQPNGKIVVVGYATGIVRDYAVVRYHPDGSLDSTFSGDGILLVDFLGFYDFGHAVVLQPDGKIILSGSATNGYSSDFGLVRLK